MPIHRMADLWHLRVQERIRVFVIGLCLFLTLIGGSLWVNPSSYHIPIYTEALKLCSPAWWGLGFLVPAVFLLAAAITERFVLWAIGLFFSILVSVTWYSLIVLSYLDGAPLTVSGAVLWAWFLFTNILMASSKTQVIPRPTSTHSGETSDGSL